MSVRQIAEMKNMRNPNKHSRASTATSTGSERPCENVVDGVKRVKLWMMWVTLFRLAVCKLQGDVIVFHLVAGTPLAESTALQSMVNNWWSSSGRAEHSKKEIASAPND